MTTRSHRSIGFAVVLLGIWGGILPFVGPLFGYRMLPGSAWSWTAGAAELHVGPGVLVLLGGLMLLAGGKPRFGALLAFIGGTWFVVGPLFASLWLGPVAAETRVASAGLMQAMAPLGYHYGTGLVIVALAARAGRRTTLPAKGTRSPGAAPSSQPSPTPQPVAH